MKTELIQEALFALFGFFGGFGLFMYGMHIMATGLQKAAGSKMKNFMGMLTSNRFLAVTVGAVVTAIIQSSSATTVMVVGFVNAGLLNLTQAVGVIMGANIGTTATSWIVSSSEWAAFLKPKELAPLAIFIGASLLFFSRKKYHNRIGEILVGFGLIFIGLEFMSDAIYPYRNSEVFQQSFLLLGKSPILGILAGALVTAIIQSSSASVGILQMLAVSGLVPWNAAVYIILGQNIGTCVTAMLSSIGANKTAKRAAVIHLLFNVIGTVVFAVLSIIYFKMINTSLGEQIIDITDISIFHTAFNIANTVILFPFANVLVKLSEKIVKGEDSVDRSESGVALRHMDERILETPSFAVENAINEVVHMGNVAANSLETAIKAIVEGDMGIVEEVRSIEKDVNQLERLITDYLIKIANTELTEKQHLVVQHLFNTVNDIERVGDHAVNISELAEFLMSNEVVFSPKAMDELIEMAEYTLDTYKFSVNVREAYDSTLVHKVEDREENIDKIEEKLREAHIKRLASYQCKAEAGVVFLDVLSNLERVSDHALNIVQYVQAEVTL